MIRLIQRELKMGGRGFTIRQDSVGETYQLHCHDFYEFFLVTKGRALHVVNDTYQIVSRGSLVFVRPDDTHCYDYYKSQDFSFYNSGIPHAYYEKICGYYGSRMQSLDELPVSKHIHISDTLTRRLEEQLSSLRDVQVTPETELQYLLLLSEVMYCFLSEDSLWEDGQLPDWLLRVLDEMAHPENFIEGLPRLLCIANYSQEYVNREFQRYLHTTPTRYINEQRLKYAHHLLCTTDMLIVDICEACGFHNLSHFYSRFREYFGCSPTAVRKEAAAQT